MDESSFPDNPHWKHDGGFIVNLEAPLTKCECDCGAFV